MNDPDELDRFKRIDLREYAASLGYRLNQNKSSRNCAVMEGPDKIVINRAQDGHYIYFAVGGDHSGSIINLDMRITGNLGVTRKRLRAFIGAAIPVYSPMGISEKDPAHVLKEFMAMSVALRHPYLEVERCIPASLLSSERFRGCVFTGRYGNAVFPHKDEFLTGFEIKNRNFTGFAKGGSKSLWRSNDFSGDRRLVFAEVAIDAFSHAALIPDALARYRSIAGEMNEDQPHLIRSDVMVMPEGSTIVAAFDANPAGCNFSDRLAMIVKERADVLFRLDQPPMEDWNDVLKNSFPAAPSFLSP